MSVFDVLQAAAGGMEAQRAALDVAARNVAAAEAAGPKGSYERLVPRFRLVRQGETQSVAFAGTRAQRGSDVDVVTEMIAVMNASRAYEANASVFDAGKQLAERTIEMGRL